MIKKFIQFRKAMMILNLSSKYNLKVSHISLLGEFVNKRELKGPKKNEFLQK